MKSYRSICSSLLSRANPLLNLRTAHIHTGIRLKMKEAIVHPGPRVEVIESQVPEPGTDQVVTKVVVSGSNPKVRLNYFQSLSLAKGSIMDI